MSGDGQRGELELEEGGKKGSNNVKGKLRKIWKKQSTSKKNDKANADKEASDLVTKLSAKKLSLHNR